MNPLIYFDRQTGKEEVERVYGASALNLLYGDSLANSLAGRHLARIVAKVPFFSGFYGWLQKSSGSKRKIKPFIKTFGIDETEFLEPADSFHSFNDFFIRKLKPGARPIAPGGSVAIIPADARYLFFENISMADGFLVKGKKFQLETLLESEALAQKYEQGSMVLARLCPTDYHRFHFPCDCIPGPARLINGWLYSVNPIALKRDIEIFSQNKRVITELQTEHFGKVLYIEVGATNVGSIHQTYSPGHKYHKGEEKGYFSFGASSIILLFEPHTIRFDQDLLKASSKKMEIKCLLGQSMATAVV